MLRAYIPNQGNNTVSIVDTVNNIITAAISGFSEPAGAAVSPDGTQVYVTNPSGTPGTVSVIDTASNTIAATIDVGTNPNGVAFSPDGSTVYVSNHNDGTVSVINVGTQSVTDTITLAGGAGGPFGLTVSPDGSKVYVANQNNNTISVIKTSDNSVAVITDTSFNYPNTIAFTPDSSIAYVCNYLGGTISIIDVATASVTGTITIGDGVWAVVITPDGMKAYVTWTESGTTNSYVTVIDIATSSTVGLPILVGYLAWGLSITPDGNYVYVTVRGSNAVSVISTATEDIVTSISGFDVPQSWGFFIQSGSTIMTTPYTAPQGRLTLTSSTPVMIADATAQTSVYYAPYQGDLLPLWNGSDMVMYEFSQLTMTLNTSNQLSGKIYDLFVFLNSSVVTIGAGPAWSSSTARGTGSGTTQLQQTNGIWTNANSITLKNGSTSYSSIPAGEATYLGSVYMTANGQTGMQFKPAAASGGSNNILGLYNAYNRVNTSSYERDSTTSWAVSGSVFETMNNGTGGGTGNRITFLDGLQQSQISSTIFCYMASTSFAALGVVLNNATTGTNPEVFISVSPTTVTSSISEPFPPQLGVNYLQLMQYAGSGGATFYGGGEQQCFIVSLEM